MLPSHASATRPTTARGEDGERLDEARPRRFGRDEAGHLPNPRQHHQAMDDDVSLHGSPAALPTKNSNTCTRSSTSTVYRLAGRRRSRARIAGFAEEEATPPSALGPARRRGASSPPFGSRPTHFGPPAPASPIWAVPPPRQPLRWPCSLCTSTELQLRIAAAIPRRLSAAERLYAATRPAAGAHRRRRAAAADAARRGRSGSAHRLRQHRQPAARAGASLARRTGDASGAGRAAGR